MERKDNQSQAQVPGQKQDRKAKGNPKVQSEPGKAIQKSKMENVKQASSQPPKSPDSESEGEFQKVEPHLKMNPKVKVSTLEVTRIRIKKFYENKDKNQKPLRGKLPTEQAAAVIPKAVRPKPPDSFSDEHKGRGAEKDGSESDNGYTTFKKRKAKHNVTKAEEDFNLMRFRVKPSAPKAPILQQDFESLKLYSSDPKGIKVDSPKSEWKSERWAVGAGRGRSEPEYTQEKAFDTSPGPKNPKVDLSPTIVPTAPVVPKEEGWSLFKQPTIFPLGKSNVPKVTYASKLKQNLYKAQSPSRLRGSCPQSQLPPQSLAILSSSSAFIGSSIQMPSRSLTQVPMTAIKTVSSLDFANRRGKSMTSDSSQVLPLEERLIKCPSSTSKSVIHKIDPSCPPVQESLFTCPLNMPPAPMGLMPNITPNQREIQMLREISQNEWGLSFFSEISIIPEMTQQMAPDPKVIQPPLPHKYPDRMASQETGESPCILEHVLLPRVYNLSKWFNPQDLGGVIEPPVPVRERKEALMPESSLKDDHPQQADPKSHRAFKLLPSNYKTESPESFPISPSPDSTWKDPEQENAQESFDVRATVEFHMREIKSILDMMDQDSEKTVIYDETMHD